MTGVDGRRRASRWRAALVLGVAVVAAGSGIVEHGAAAAAAAKASGRPASPKRSSSAVTVAAPFHGVVDYSTCIDPESISCHAASEARIDGFGSASAGVAPELGAGSGRAIGQGGPLAEVALAKPTAALRVTLQFGTGTASVGTWVETACVPSSSAPCWRPEAESVDLAARAMIGGYVSHSACEACTATVHRVIADADPQTRDIGTTASGELGAPVVVEVRNPAGQVPAGTLTAVGLFVADVGPVYGRIQPLYASKGYAELRGSLTKVSVEPLAS